MLIKNGEKANSPFKPLNILAGLLILAGVVVLIIQSQTKTETQASENTPAFQLAGEQYWIENLPPRYRQQYYEVANQAYQRQQTILQTAATELYISQQMKENEETRESVIKRLFNPAPPSAQQIQEFYQQNQHRINAPLAQAQNQIALLLMSQQQQQKQQELLANLAQLGEYQLFLERPKAPSVDINTLDYPSKGAENATVTLIEFGDYQCSHCRDAFDEMKALWPDFQDKVKFVYMDFPIHRSGISRKVAEGAYCANQQGQFWEFHNRAFEQQSSLSEQSPKQFAESLGLDMTTFNACIEEPATAEAIKASAQQALKSGVTATPTFFLNGIKLSDLDRKQGLRSLLEQAIEAGPVATAN